MSAFGLAPPNRRAVLQGFGQIRRQRQAAIDPVGRIQQAFEGLVVGLAGYVLPGGCLEVERAGAIGAGPEHESELVEIGEPVRSAVAASEPMGDHSTAPGIG